jgi:hypothetical protein
MESATYFPGYFVGAWHAWRVNSVLGARDNYFVGYYLRYFAAGVFRIAVELYLAGWLYRCGPKVSRFLLGDAEDSQG